VSRKPMDIRDSVNLHLLYSRRGPCGHRRQWSRLWDGTVSILHCATPGCKHGTGTDPDGILTLQVGPTTITPTYSPWVTPTSSAFVPGYTVSGGPMPWTSGATVTITSTGTFSTSGTTYTIGPTKTAPISYKFKREEFSRMVELDGDAFVERGYLWRQEGLVTKQEFVLAFPPDRDAEEVEAEKWLREQLREIG
jgi:hypothetical protein